MKLEDFNFSLPPAQIARYPLKKRSESRLMCLDTHTDQISDKQFSDITRLLSPGDLLIFNDTKVIPARLFGKKTTGGGVEVLVERILDKNRMLAQIRVSKPPRMGDRLEFPNGVMLQVAERKGLFYELHYLKNDQSILEVVENIGHIPLPPYMDRAPNEMDMERYQTVYASQKGSVAAPTAGLHFDKSLMHDLAEKQIDSAFLTLHIGAGTFTPVRVEDITTHSMHTEYYEVTESLCKQINETKGRGGRVVAVGTTSLRALESASQSGRILPYQGETNIFIYPGFHFHCVDALITNLHLPCSSLLMLVCAFGGYEKVMKAYQHALKQKYRFYSYGDAMWLERSL